MQRICETQEAPTPQALYDVLNTFIDDLEADVYGLDELFTLLGLTLAFLEANFEVT